MLQQQSPTFGRRISLDVQNDKFVTPTKKDTQSLNYMQRHAHTTNSDFKNFSSESSRGAGRLTTLSPDSFISPIGGLHGNSSQRLSEAAEFELSMH